MKVEPGPKPGQGILRARAGDGRMGTVFGRTLLSPVQFLKMNPNLRRLFKIAQKPERTVVGLMSGTSLDGLDIALCSVKGCGRETELKLLQFQTAAYDELFKAEIRSVFAKQTIDFQQLVLLHATVARRHAALLLAALKDWGIEPSAVDLLASHGQTVFHAPASQHGLKGQPNATLQIGDGDHMAVLTGITTVSDFRQKHIAAGGEGAPLALYGDHLLFSHETENRVLVNIGGIANFTWLPRLQSDRVFATDTGPGNTLMDFAARRFFQKDFDDGGRIAASGSVAGPLFDALLAEPFFRLPFPRTTGPELFSPQFLEKAQKASGSEHIEPADLMATLNFFTAKTLADAIQKSAETDGIETRNLSLYLSGGGAHNPVLRENLKSQLPESHFFNFQNLGLDGDAKEAVLFAVLANEAVAGEAFPAIGLNGQPGVSMGKISFPN